MPFVCETCKSTFISKGNLSSHTKTAKYCRILREGQITTVLSFACDICAKTFTTKHNFQQHYINCSSHTGYIKFKDAAFKTQLEVLHLKTDKIQLQNTLQEKDIIISDLRSDLQKLIQEKDLLVSSLRYDLQQLSLEAVRRPTNSTINNTNNNTNTTNINNLAIFDRNELVNIIERNPINKQIMDKGVPGVAHHVGSLMKRELDKPNYLVTDASRLKCKYKTEDGTIVTDHKCTAVVSSLSPNLSDQATDVFRGVESSYEIRLKIHNLENTKIPSLKESIKQVEKQLEDLPDRRTQDHPDRKRFNQLVDDYEAELDDYYEQLTVLKRQAENTNVRLDVPIEFYADDLDKTSRNLRDIKDIAGDTKGTFAKSFIETIS